MGMYRGPRIITEDLILYLDAGNDKSYTGSGSSWNSLLGGYSGTLANAPTFTSSFPKHFTFNGSNQMVNTNLPNSVLGESFSLICVFTKQGNNSITAISDRIFTANRTATATKWCLGWRQNGNLSFAGTGGSETLASFSIPTGVFIFCGLSYNNNVYSMFINNELVVNGSSAGVTNTTNFENIAIAGRPDNSDRFMNGKLAIAMIYNRNLSNSEILQNFNALRGRFGL